MPLLENLPYYNHVFPHMEPKLRAERNKNNELIKNLNLFYTYGGAHHINCLELWFTECWIMDHTTTRMELVLIPPPSFNLKELRSKSFKIPCIICISLFFVIPKGTNKILQNLIYDWLLVTHWSYTHLLKLQKTEVSSSLLLNRYNHVVSVASTIKGQNIDNR